MIAGIYTALSLLTFPVSSGAIQLRVSELLCVLPILYVEAVPALFIGCALSNLITGCAPFDILLGSFVTLVSAIFTYLFGRIIKNKYIKLIVGGIFPVLLNAFLLPLIWIFCYGAIEYLYIVQASFIFIGQALAVYGLGAPTYISVVKLKEKGLSFLE